MRRVTRTLVVAFTLIASAAWTQPLPKATPESVGMSTERLSRMHAGMQALVDTHQAGGIVTLRRARRQDGRPAGVRFPGRRRQDVR